MFKVAYPRLERMVSWEVGWGPLFRSGIELHLCKGDALPSGVILFLYVLIVRTAVTVIIGCPICIRVLPAFIW